MKRRHSTKADLAPPSATVHAVLDDEGVPLNHFEFGGSLGNAALIVGFPLLMWYMFVAAKYYDGRLPLPTGGESWTEFVRHMVGLAYAGAYPTRKAWLIYWSFFALEVLLYYTLPGVTGYGKQLRHEGGRQLKYFCNAYISFYTTILIATLLHISGIFPLYTVIDEFGPIMTVAIFSGFINSIAVYVSAIIGQRTHRLTGYAIYDFFMGAELNPRLGILDLKMFYEVRIPWFILFLISSAAAARQYESYGYVSKEVAFIVMAHFLYANACAKGEHLIITSWDMYFEKLGFMLTFWNMAGVPFSYCHCALYLASHEPSEYHWGIWPLGALAVAYLFFYWVWDTANGQKNGFRQMERGQLLDRNTWPRLPWLVVRNPKAIDTTTGDRIMVDGWFGVVRKPHYTADMFFAVSWALVTGFKSPLPWFYPVFFCIMILHRTRRDIHKCRNKYGEAWKQYERAVPYLYVPYLI
ncbi:C-24(28) sterol reductase [Truncatella angustata]|uniref:Delta(24(24(1)))-sterol reductase n=1 Tax=Truncatella angustata TaxID=152316 RepID=A0A9P9A1M9_9PEZI|nr:C-24(28) sterol reductase [Truncatella angustata]KAH6658264.1 C-24(28) sterol reductase [Truncatella angustata]